MIILVWGWLGYLSMGALSIINWVMNKTISDQWKLRRELLCYFFTIIIALVTQVILTFAIPGLGQNGNLYVSTAYSSLVSVLTNGVLLFVSVRIPLLIVMKREETHSHSNVINRGHIPLELHDTLNNIDAFSQFTSHLQSEFSLEVCNTSYPYYIITHEMIDFYYRCMYQTLPRPPTRTPPLQFIYIC